MCINISANAPSLGIPDAEGMGANRITRVEVAAFASHMTHDFSLRSHQRHYFHPHLLLDLSYNERVHTTDLMLSLSPSLKSRLSSPLYIGSFAVNSRVLQSPLSGVTDLVFRRLVRRYAPDSMMYTEMVNATGLHYVKELPKIMEVDPNERPISIQLFDCRPDFLAAAAQMAVAEGADTIDINMGCPVNKITKNGGGSSLLRQPEVAAAIVRSVVEAVQVPVTVKTRIGWSDQEINAVEFAQRMQDAGAQMLTLHGRTRAQGYNGSARWEWIAKVKAALSIPVIANGDIFSVEAAVRCLEQTGADGVMCSRGTLGYPFLVGEVDHFLKTGTLREPPTPIERLQCAREHLEMLWQYKGDRGIRQARKHMAWYAKGFVGAADLRGQLSVVETLEQGFVILDRAIDLLQELEIDALPAIEPTPALAVV